MSFNTALAPSACSSETSSSRRSLDGDAMPMKGTPAAPYPLATRGHFYEDEELAAHASAAGFRHVEVRRPHDGAQLLVARP